MALDESVIQQALIQVADATRAAVQVAQTAVRVQSSGAAPSTADGQRSGSLVDGSKLISKPNVFDNKSAEEDIRSFRDWHWMLSQYLTAIDQGFAAELKQLDDDPSKPPRVDNSVSRDASEIQQIVWPFSICGEKPSP